MNRTVFMPVRRSGKTWARDRLYSHIHAVAHARERGIDLDLADIERIEDTVKRMTAAFDTPDKSLHFITTRYQGQRFTVLFDTRQGYIIGIGAARPLVSAPRWMMVVDEGGGHA